MKQRTVLKKLKSEKGASSIVALLFFLVAMMVGSVVLASASANAGRASHALKDQQEYYAVESAIDLIRGEIDYTKNDKVKVEIIKDFSSEKDDTTIQIFGSQLLYKLMGVTKDADTGDGLLSVELDTAGTPKTLIQEKTTFELSVSDESYKIPDVIGKMSITNDGKYLITVKLKAVENAENDSAADSGEQDGEDDGGTGDDAAPDYDDVTGSNEILLKYAVQQNTTKQYSIDDNGDASGVIEITTLKWYEISSERPKTST